MDWKKEYQIVVNKDADGDYWFTAQKRKPYFLFSGFWKNITPMRQPTYQDALELIYED